MNNDNNFENEQQDKEMDLELDGENLEQDYDEVEEFREIVLTLEDDSELTCLVVAQYQVGEQD
ncbi:hypothetical protein, partial [Rhodovulum adriaticum]|uniref:hypothetical protein n=1 Tax=Rhodovulum adriaticum TaxID=35804 RepID=UPI001903DA05